MQNERVILDVVESLATTITALREIIGQSCQAGGGNEIIDTPETFDTGLNALALEIHENAVDHGWWEKDRELPEVLMLCVSELAEALEEAREGRPFLYIKCCKCRAANAGSDDACLGVWEKGSLDCKCLGQKPEGIAVEMADCIIRILDYCGRKKIDIDAAIRMKMEYNKDRSYRHGGKLF